MILFLGILELARAMESVGVPTLAEVGTPVSGNQWVRALCGAGGAVLILRFFFLPPLSLPLHASAPTTLLSQSSPSKAVACDFTWASFGFGDSAGKGAFSSLLRFSGFTFTPPIGNGDLNGTAPRKM